MAKVESEMDACGAVMPVNRLISLGKDSRNSSQIVDALGIYARSMFIHSLLKKLKMDCYAGTYSIPGDTRFCTLSGNDIKAIANMDYVVKKNGAEFHLTAPRGDETRLGATDIAALEAARTSQDKTSDKIFEGSENTFFSTGQIDGLFKFTEVKLQSGHMVGIL